MLTVNFHFVETQNKKIMNKSELNHEVEGCSSGKSKAAYNFYVYPGISDGQWWHRKLHKKINNYNKDSRKRLETSSVEVISPRGDNVQTPVIIKTIVSIQNEYDTANKLEALPTPASNCPEKPTAAFTRMIDYIPPSKIKRRHSTSELDDDMTPAKRDRSLKSSSVHSESSEPNKYREMRDKNNETCRKSRQKRKEQEMVHERKRIELEEKNVKLKTEVTELERIVSQFRTNMMEMIKK